MSEIIGEEVFFIAFLRLPNSEMNEEERMLLEYNYPTSVHIAPNGELVTICDKLIETITNLDNSYKDHINIYIHMSFINADMSIIVPKAITIGGVKTLIYSQTNIPPLQQKLTGWLEMPTSDTVCLSELNLLGIVYLNFNWDTVTVYQHEDSLMAVGFSQTSYLFKIYDEAKHIEHLIMFPGSTNISQFKSLFFTKTGIPESYQIWSGWPKNVTDESELCEIDLELPIHCLKLLSNAVVEECPLFDFVNNHNDSDDEAPLYSPISINKADIDSSSEDAEDAVGSERFSNETEMIDNVTVSASRPLSLIPDDIDNEEDGVTRFHLGYIQRYGLLCPNFHLGTLKQAIQEASPAKQSKILAIYLHHDGSSLTNVFCSQLLRHETVLQTFANNFVIWGWDITNQNSKEIFWSSARRLLGSSLTELMQRIRIDLLPALVIISKSRTKVELLNVIHANTHIDQLLMNLNNAIDEFNNIQTTESKEEEKRAPRKRHSSEKYKAYKASLKRNSSKNKANKQKSCCHLMRKKD